MICIKYYNYAEIFGSFKSYKYLQRKHFEHNNFHLFLKLITSCITIFSKCFMHNLLFLCVYLPLPVCLDNDSNQCYLKDFNNSNLIYLKVESAFILKYSIKKPTRVRNDKSLKNKGTFRYRPFPTDSVKLIKPFFDEGKKGK